MKPNKSNAAKDAARAALGTIERLESDLATVSDAASGKRAEAESLRHEADARQLRARTGDVSAAAEVPQLRRRAAELNREAAGIEASKVKDASEALDVLLGDDADPAEAYRSAELGRLRAELAELAPDAARLVSSARVFADRASAVLRAAAAFGVSIADFDTWHPTASLFGETVVLDLDPFRCREGECELDDAVRLLRSLEGALDRQRERRRDRAAAEYRERHAAQYSAPGMNP